MLKKYSNKRICAPTLGVLAFCWALLVGQACQGTDPKKPLGKIKNRVEKIAKQHNIPTLVMTITTRHDSVRLDYTHPDVSPQALYGIRSDTKLMDAVLYFSSWEQGKTSLSDSVGALVASPGIVGFERLQLGHLLSHTSGLADYTQHPEWGSHVVVGVAPVDFSQKMGYVSKGLGQGGVFAYSNTNFLVLEKVIAYHARVSHHTAFERYYRQNGLGSIQLGPPGQDLEAYHAATESGSANVSQWQEHYGYDGGAYMAPNDFHRFGQQLLVEKSLLGEKALGQMRQWVPMGAFTIPIGTGSIAQYGHGLMQLTYRDRQWVGHAGSTLKYQAMVWCEPSSQTVVTLLTNGSAQFYNQVFFQKIMPAVLDLSCDDDHAPDVFRFISQG